MSTCTTKMIPTLTYHTGMGPSASTVAKTDTVGHQLQYLIDKRLVHEVRPPDAEIQDVNPLHDGVVEGVQEPGGVGHLARVGNKKNPSKKTHPKNPPKKPTKMFF
jgi:hypothetical protein